GERLIMARMTAAIYFRWQRATTATFVLCCAWEAACWIVRPRSNRAPGTRRPYGFAGSPRNCSANLFARNLLPQFLPARAITALAAKTPGRWCELDITRDVLFRPTNCTWTCGGTASIWQGMPGHISTTTSLRGTTALPAPPFTTRSWWIAATRCGAPVVFSGSIGRKHRADLFLRRSQTRLRNFRIALKESTTATGASM